MRPALDPAASPVITASEPEVPVEAAPESMLTDPLDPIPAAPDSTLTVPLVPNGFEALLLPLDNLMEPPIVSTLFPARSIALPPAPASAAPAATRTFPLAPPTDIPDSSFAPPTCSELPRPISIWTEPDTAESADLIEMRPLADVGEVDAPEVINTPRRLPSTNTDPPLDETDLPADSEMPPALPADVPVVSAIEPDSVLTDAVEPDRNKTPPTPAACKLMPMPLPIKLLPSATLSRPSLCKTTDPPAELPVPAAIEVNPPAPEPDAPAVTPMLPVLTAAGPVTKLTCPEVPEAAAPLARLTDPPRASSELCSVSMEIDPEPKDVSVRTKTAPDVPEVPVIRSPERIRTDPSPASPARVAAADTSTLPALAAPLVLPAETTTAPLLDTLSSPENPPKKPI